MTHSTGKHKVGRPNMAAGYGLGPVESENDLLAWEAVEDQLRAAHNYWISSTRPDGRPHAMPVWGIWMDGAFYFSTDPHSRKGRNLSVNPEMVVHLESGDNVVILEGRAAIITDLPVKQQADQAYFAKYQVHLTGEGGDVGSIYQLRPRQAFAWLESTFTASATRWKFEV